RNRLFAGGFCVSWGHLVVRSDPLKSARRWGSLGRNWGARSRIGVVELIPKAVIVGVLAAAQPGPLDRDQVNRVWTELSARQEYKQFNFAGEAAQFIGTGPDDALVLQLPLVQFRSTARMGVKNAADEAQVVFKTVARHLGLAQFFNLGIKHV